MRALPDHRGGGIRGLAKRLGGIAPAAGASIVRSRLFIKYVALFVAVVSLALVANGAFDPRNWRYRGHRDRSDRPGSEGFSIGS
jgi:hypothetical protein